MRLRRALRRLTGDAWIFDPVGAGVRVPAIAAALTIGFATGRPLQGIVAATGAYLVGFGAPLDLFGSNLVLLVVATVVLGTSATLGSVAAFHGVLAIAVASALGALCGFAASRDVATAWVALQCAVAGVVATGYPASLPRALERALLISAGGVAQTLVLTAARFARRPVRTAPAEASEPRFAILLAVALGLATAVERALHLRNGYWVPATTLLVLRPTTLSTLARGVSRSVGTLVGVSVGSAVVMTTQVRGLPLAALVCLAAFGAYVFQKATYGLFSACVGMYVVFILSLGGVSEAEVAIARLEATLVGTAIGLAVQLVDGWARRPDAGRARVA